MYDGLVSPNFCWAQGCPFFLKHPRVPKLTSSYWTPLLLFKCMPHVTTKTMWEQKSSVVNGHAKHAPTMAMLEVNTQHSLYIELTEIWQHWVVEEDRASVEDLDTQWTSNLNPKFLCKLLQRVWGRGLFLHLIFAKRCVKAATCVFFVIGFVN